MTASTKYEVGTRVEILKGRYAGTRGTVWMATAKELGVDFDVPVRGDSNGYVRASSVKVAP